VFKTEEWVVFMCRDKHLETNQSVAECANHLKMLISATDPLPGSSAPQHSSTIGKGCNFKYNGSSSLREGDIS
jgi:hypothetical protein